MSSDQHIVRIAKDLANLQQTADLSLAAACRDTDIRRVRTLVIGPADTPYEHGFFEFEFVFPSRYPMQSPTVTCITTNRGRTRFNPNIYSTGRVCLSTLGTWSGDRGESWSCCQSLESVLISIQSLLAPNPYSNEPGLEETPSDDSAALAYARKVRHESLRITVIDRLEHLLGINLLNAADDDDDNDENEPAPPMETPGSNDHDSLSDQDAPDKTNNEADNNDLDDWDPFADLIKHRFLWYYDAYQERLTEAADLQKDGASFRMTMFESPDNGMQGEYEYQKLITRLSNIYKALTAETEEWIMTGLKQTAASSSLARQLSITLANIKELSTASVTDRSRLEVDLYDAGNPFAWRLTIFGESMTNLDGGIFEVKLVFPPNFPDTSPRASMITPIHHRNVSSNGIIGYTPRKPEDISAHLAGIVAAIDDKEPKYDPRAVVNPHASSQFWASTEERKVYNRMLRRSAQESTAR